MDRNLSAGERRRQRVRAALPWVAGVVGAVALVLWGAGALRPGLEADETRTARVTRGDLEATLTASGVVVPADEEIVSSPLETRVLRILQRPGAVVEEGEPLLALDVAAARLALEQVENRMAQSADEASQAGADLAEELLELETRRALAQLDVEDRGHEVERNERLFEEGLVADVLLRQSRVRLRKAELELAQAERTMTIRRKAGESRARRLASQLGALESERDQARRELELATTRAPRGGVLTWIVADEGATVRRGDVLARIADLRSFRVEASVADLHATRVHEGQEVIVPLGLAGDERLRGRIARVLPAIEEGRLRFEVALDRPSHPALRASQRIDVHVVTERRSDALTLPRGAYLNGSGPQHVFVIDGDAARRRSVEIGLAGAERWEVLSGLSEGDELIVSDVSSIRHLSSVRWSDSP